MSTELYYFSGTGNSLFAAKELQKRIPDAALIPIVSLLDRKEIRISGDAIGFVFPVHALTIPIAVKQFIQKADFSSAGYLFAVATRQGTVFHGFEDIGLLLNKKQKQLNAHFLLNMYSNDVLHEGYTPPTREDIQALEKTVLEKLDIAADIIGNRQESREKGDGAVAHQKHKYADNPVFYVDSKCTGCGLCRKVCLSGKIAMIGGKPEWQKKIPCYMCFACLNYCPRHAVQIKSTFAVKSFTEQNGRYPHPYASSSDISAQKETI